MAVDRIVIDQNPSLNSLFSVFCSAIALAHAQIKRITPDNDSYKDTTQKGLYLHHSMSASIRDKKSLAYDRKEKDLCQHP